MDRKIRLFVKKYDELKCSEKGPTDHSWRNLIAVSLISSIIGAILVLCIFLPIVFAMGPKDDISEIEADIARTNELISAKTLVNLKVESVDFNLYLGKNEDSVYLIYTSPTRTEQTNYYFETDDHTYEFKESFNKFEVKNLDKFVLRIENSQDKKVIFNTSFRIDTSILK